MSHQKMESKLGDHAESSLLIQPGLRPTDQAANALFQIVMNPDASAPSAQIAAQLMPYRLSTYDRKQRGQATDGLKAILLSTHKDTGRTLWDHVLDNKTHLLAFLNALNACYLFSYGSPLVIRCIFQETIQRLVTAKNVASLQVLFDFIRPGRYDKKEHFERLFDAATIQPGSLTKQEMMTLVTIATGTDQFILFRSLPPCRDPLTLNELSQLITPLLTAKVPNAGLDLLNCYARQPKTFRASPSEDNNAVTNFYHQMVQAQLALCTPASFVTGLTQTYSADFIGILLDQLPQNGLNACVSHILYQEDPYTRGSHFPTLSKSLEALFEHSVCPEKWWVTAPWNERFLTPDTTVVNPERRFQWMRFIVSYLLKQNNPAITATVREVYKQAGPDWLNPFLSAVRETERTSERFNLSFDDMKTHLYTTEQRLGRQWFKSPHNDQLLFVDDLLRYRRKRNAYEAERYGFGIFQTGYTKTEKCQAIEKVLTHLYGNNAEKQAAGAITAEDVAILKQGNLGYVTEQHSDVFERIRLGSQAFLQQPLQDAACASI